MKNCTLRTGGSVLLLSCCLSGLLGLLSSCTGLPKAASPAAVKPEKPAAPVIPALPRRIMGKGLMEEEKLASFLMRSNDGTEAAFVKALARYYVEEADVEGVNHDVAFAQMCLETGFLRYGNLVTADMNNFCGLGAIGPEKPGETFPSPRIGVRAHIQHLKAYASEEPLRQDLVDPRYRWVRYGSSPLITGLAGTWAADKEYAVKINKILERLYQYAYNREG
ncbi:hypothetical protein FACS189468_5160 [Spirochaetia bacterium]|nr:hypothetical protein FACS189468_5160 [Spirochaetia bacterium]